MKKTPNRGIPAAAWFYSQSFHGNIDSSLESGGSSHHHVEDGSNSSKPSQAPVVAGGEGGELASPSQKGKFTPGPWHVEKGEVCDSAGLLVCAEIMGERKEIYEANTNLIAAAPQMHDALRAILYWYDVDSEEFNREIAINKVRSALLSAEGKEGGQ